MSTCLLQDNSQLGILLHSQVYCLQESRYHLHTSRLPGHHLPGSAGLLQMRLHGPPK